MADHYLINGRNGQSYIYTRKTASEIAQMTDPYVSRELYKMRPELQAEWVARITNIATTNTQFGYKNVLAAIGEIVKIEQSIRTGLDNARIGLLGVSNAFGCVSRTLLRAEVAKSGLPVTPILHSKSGYVNTNPRCKGNTNP